MIYVYIGRTIVLLEGLISVDPDPRPPGEREFICSQSFALTCRFLVVGTECCVNVLSSSISNIYLGMHGLCRVQLYYIRTDS